MEHFTVDAETMTIHVGIPARMGSKRFPGKPLADLHGQPMIVRLAKPYFVNPPEHWVMSVVTPDLEVFAACNKHDVPATLVVDDPMGKTECGTDRVWRWCKHSIAENDRMVVLQGDQFGVPPSAIEWLGGAYNPRTLITHANVRAIHDVGAYLSGPIYEERATFFSRAWIPGDAVHIGAYGYSQSNARHFHDAAPREHARAADLEQMRVIQSGGSFEVRRLDGFRTMSVNSPADLDQLRELDEDDRIFCPRHTNVYPQQHTVGEQDAVGPNAQ